MPTKRTQVLVCAGTGCTIGNSGELITEFEKEIKALGLEKEVEVLRTGCLGLCGVGPNISIYPDNIIYKTVQVSDVKEIVMEHFYKGRPVHRLMLNESDEETKEIHDINDTKFYNKQKRIARRRPVSRARPHPSFYGNPCARLPFARDVRQPSSPGCL